jgi:predicted membrane-bound dolichyl-phosphate-mannose-protein mannosyltransferase
MADTETPRLSAAAGRRFAFTLALGFGALALLFLWRDRPTLVRVAAGLAALIAVAGLTVPRHLGPVERAWTGLGMALGRVTAPIFIGVVYWLIITPVGVVRRTLGRSPLSHRTGTSLWVSRAPDTRDPRDRMTRQF